MIIIDSYLVIDNMSINLDFTYDTCIKVICFPTVRATSVQLSPHKHVDHVHMSLDYKCGYHIRYMSFFLIFIRASNCRFNSYFINFLVYFIRWQLCLIYWKWMVVFAIARWEANGRSASNWRCRTLG